MPFVDAHNFEHSDADIFLSCSHAEDGRKADLLADKLSDCGFNVFYTRRSMQPGYSYAEMIHRYLLSCPTIVVCWSPSAVKSPHVHAEGEYGRVHNKLVSCKLAACELMPPFNTFQTADLSTWNGEDEHPTWRALLALLEHRKSGKIEPYRLPLTRLVPAPSSRNQKLLLGAALIAALLVGLAVGWSLHRG